MYKIKVAKRNRSPETAMRGDAAFGFVADREINESDNVNISSFDLAAKQAKLLKGYFLTLNSLKNIVKREILAVYDFIAEPRKTFTSDGSMKILENADWIYCLNKIRESWQGKAVWNVDVSEPIIKKKVQVKEERGGWRYKTEFSTDSKRRDVSIVMFPNPIVKRKLNLLSREGRDFLSTFDMEFPDGEMEENQQPNQALGKIREILGTVEARTLSGEDKLRVKLLDEMLTWSNASWKDHVRFIDIRSDVPGEIFIILRKRVEECEELLMDHREQLNHDTDDNNQRDVEEDNVEEYHEEPKEHSEGDSKPDEDWRDIFQKNGVEIVNDNLADSLTKNTTKLQEKMRQLRERGIDTKELLDKMKKEVPRELWGNNNESNVKFAVILNKIVNDFIAAIEGRGSEVDSDPKELGSGAYMENLKRFIKTNKYDPPLPKERYKSTKLATEEEKKKTRRLFDSKYEGWHKLEEMIRRVKEGKPAIADLPEDDLSVINDTSLVPVCDTEIEDEPMITRVVGTERFTPTDTMIEMARENLKILKKMAEQNVKEIKTEKPVEGNWKDVFKENGIRIVNNNLEETINKFIDDLNERGEYVRSFGTSSDVSEYMEEFNVWWRRLFDENIDNKTEIEIVVKLDNLSKLKMQQVWKKHVVFPVLDKMLSNCTKWFGHPHGKLLNTAMGDKYGEQISGNLLNFIRDLKHEELMSRKQFVLARKRFDELTDIFNEIKNYKQKHVR